MGVPEANAKGVNDILVLDGVQQLLDIQVFTIKDMDQARALSRAEKDRDVQNTLDDFKAIAEVVGEQGEKVLQNGRVQEKLEAVLEKMPNHISAQLLLDHARGKAPEKLSVGGSFHEIDSRASGVFSRVQMSMLRKKDPSDLSDFKEDAQATMGELLQIEGKVHEKFEDYYAAAMDLCGAIQETLNIAANPTIREKWEKVSKMRKKLSEDPEIMEEIRG